MDLNLTPQEVDHLDRTAVLNSALVIAYIGRPALGPGIEIEIARAAKIPVVVIYEADRLSQKKVSRLARGNPAVVKEISFANKNDAERQLREFLITGQDTVF